MPSMMPLQLCIDLFEGPAQTHRSSGSSPEPEVATPPALAALAGPNRTPVRQVDLDGLGGAGHVCALADHGARRSATRASADSASISFWVAQGRAMSQGTVQTLRAALQRRLRLRGRLGILLDAAAADFLDLLDVSQIDAVAGRRHSRWSRTWSRPWRPAAVAFSQA